MNRIRFFVADFARLHHEMIDSGGHHAGIVVSQQRQIGDLIRRLLNLAQSLDAATMRDRLEYLSRCPST